MVCFINKKINRLRKEARRQNVSFLPGVAH